MRLTTTHMTILSFAVLAIGCAPAPEPPAQTAAPAPELVGSVLDAAGQQALTPEQVLADLKAGNQRFVDGKLTARDYMAQAEATAVGGQYPKAIVLGCLDSRVPPEIIFDQGIGDIFVGRVAGNFENVDMLGSFEFGAKVAGSKVIVVLGHTQCGAVKGAADGVELGNLTEMLANFDEALAEAKTLVEGKFDSSNDAFVQAAVAASTREAIDLADKAGDMSTSDLFTEVSRDLDTGLWFLEAHVQG